MQGEFEPGQKLTLRKLAASLGTSMGPVREAVSRLSTYGALEIIPKRHILVVPLTAEKYMEILDVRKLLEGHAAARASKRITQKEMLKITKYNHQLYTYAKEGNLAKATIANQRFHFTIYQSADSKTLNDLIESQWFKVGPTIAKYIGEQTINDHEAFKATCQGHIKLINALRNHDALAALKEMTNIIDNTANYLFIALANNTIQSTTTLNEIWT